VIANATSQKVTLGPVPTGRTWIIDTFGVVDDTTGVTLALFSIGGLGRDLPVAGVHALTAAQPYVVSGPFRVPEGRTLSVELQGASVSDNVAVFANGIELCPDMDVQPVAN